MNLTIEKEVMAPYFNKHHVHGLPFPLSFNEFTEADISDDYHNHPFSFKTTIKSGGYAEKVLKLHPDGTFKTRTYYRLPGKTYHVKAGTIHKVVALLNGPCITQMEPDISETVDKTDWQMWKVIGKDVFYRPENKGEWLNWKPK